MQVFYVELFKNFNNCPPGWYKLIINEPEVNKEILSTVAFKSKRIWEEKEDGTLRYVFHHNIKDFQVLSRKKVNTREFFWVKLRAETLNI